MQKGYKKIIWAIILVTVHLNIGVLKILPSFVGWMILLAGLSQLETNEHWNSSSFLKPSAICLILLSLLSEGIHLFTGIPLQENVYFMFFPLFTFLLELIIFHKIIDSSINYFNKTNQQEIGYKYIKKDRIYIVLAGITSIFLAVSTVTYYEGTTTAGTLWLIVRLYVFFILYSLSKENYGTNVLKDEMDTESREFVAD